jgi:hypothetical protein
MQFTKVNDMAQKNHLIILVLVNIGKFEDRSLKFEVRRQKFDDRRQKFEEGSGLNLLPPLNGSFSTTRCNRAVLWRAQRS